MEQSKQYKKRQNKSSLGIENLKGVTVNNKQVGNQYAVTYRSEVTHNGNRIRSSYFNEPLAAAKEANKVYKEIFGNAKNAKKAGYWNVLPR